MVAADATTARVAVRAVVPAAVVVAAVVLAAASSLASSYALSNNQPLPRQNVPAGAFLFQDLV